MLCKFAHLVIDLNPRSCDCPVKIQLYKTIRWIFAVEIPLVFSHCIKHILCDIIVCAKRIVQCANHSVDSVDMNMLNKYKGNLILK